MLGGLTRSQGAGSARRARAGLGGEDEPGAACGPGRLGEVSWGAGDSR